MNHAQLPLFSPSAIANVRGDRWPLESTPRQSTFSSCISYTMGASYIDEWYAAAEPLIKGPMKKTQVETGLCCEKLPP